MDAVTHRDTMPAPAARDRRHYTLADKLAIVRESQQPGVSQASISRKHNLGKNVLWTWRKSLAGFALDAPPAAGLTDDAEVHSLRHKIADLERLLGQKSFEIEMLRGRLQSGVLAGLRSVVPGAAPTDKTLERMETAPQGTTTANTVDAGSGTHGENRWKQA